MKKTTFFDLFYNNGDFRIVIPMIQRDYAQGRSGARSEKILTDFVEALIGALTADSAHINLDFIYGSSRKNVYDQMDFEPLDGQQRLTTLFLLHWYLAQRDGRQNDFHNWMLSDGKSRFSYRTRRSSEEFFNNLVSCQIDLNNLPERPSDGSHSLSAWIRDQSWYLRAWERDPTIRGCLRALDAVHSKLQGVAQTGLYDRLCTTEDNRKRITFQILSLDEFGLSDELYIKMNARGKSLTPLEILKSELIQFIDDHAREFPSTTHGGYRLEFSQQFDGAWIDFVWKQCAASDQLDFSQRYLRLLRAGMICHHVLERTAAPGDFEKPLELFLSEKHPRLAFFRDKFRVSDQEKPDQAVKYLSGFIGRLRKIFDLLTQPNTNTSGIRKAFETGSSQRYDLEIPEWTKLTAYLIFLDDWPRHRGDLDNEALEAWMRLIRNLVDNSDIDRVARMADALTSMRILASQLLSADSGPVSQDTILQKILDVGGNLKGFSPDQWQEERIKAALMLTSPEWKASIKKAESNPYFQGNLQFLLFCSGLWPAGGQKFALPPIPSTPDEFDQWRERLWQVFPGRTSAPLTLGKLGDPDKFYWERVWLSRVAYWSKPSGTFRLPPGSGQEDKARFWKTVLRDFTRTGEDTQHQKWDLHAQRFAQKTIAAFGALDDEEIEALIHTSLNNARATSPESASWPLLLAEDPRHLAASEQRNVRAERFGRLCLLKKTNINGGYRELHLMVLFNDACALRKAERLLAMEDPVWELEEAFAHWKNLPRFSIQRHDMQVRVTVCNDYEWPSNTRHNYKWFISILIETKTADLREFVKNKLSLQESLTYKDEDLANTYPFLWVLGIGRRGIKEFEEGRAIFREILQILQAIAPAELGMHHATCHDMT